MIKRFPVPCSTHMKFFGTSFELLRGRKGRDNSVCEDCHKAQRKAWYQANKKEIAKKRAKQRRLTSSK